MQKSKTSIFVALFVLLMFSLITIWSTFSSLLLTQLSFIVVGLLIAYLISKIDLSVFFSLSFSFYLISIILLLITFVLGKNIRGSTRWIDLGFFNLQTSELTKPLLAIFYSKYLSEKSLKKTKDLLFFLFLAVIPVLLVAKQPDLGSAITIFILPITLLIISGYHKQIFILALIVSFLSLPIGSLILKPYQKQRIDTFINPYKDPKGAGYNVIQAIIAVGSGGFVGKGIKLGTQSHLNFLPERHTDFIFASFVEEFGFLGSSIFFLCFFVVFKTFLYVSGRQKDKASFLLILSGFVLMFFQFTVNVGMNIGVMPVTGITLPLFSYGGSSLLSFAFFFGFLFRQLDLLLPLEI